MHAHGDDEEPFTVHELQDLMHQLITGGFETTTGALAKGMLLLVRHPDQADKLRADPDLREELHRGDPALRQPGAGAVAAGGVPGATWGGSTSRRERR